jgi:hypothetical protein
MNGKKSKAQKSTEPVSTEPISIAPGVTAIASAARAFALEGDFLSAEPWGSGHIHDTYRAKSNRTTFDRAGTPAYCILQRINTQIFRNLAALMENIERVTAHLAAQVSGEPDSGRRVLTLIPTRSGRFWFTDVDGHAWRAFRFIANAHTIDQVSSPAQAFEAARAFGLFQRRLTSLPPPRLHDTIPNFHHTPSRFAALEDAIARDAAGRVRTSAPEIAFALARKPLTTALLDAGLPERVTHNDTKINNVLFDDDDEAGEALCVIDLDTVMPGLAPYDFGDMVRTMTCPAAEDERDLTQVRVHFPLFEAIARGYLSTAGSFLTPAEKDALVLAGKLITFETGIRFLADHLNGDTYFKVHREGHNLDRCRTQFALVASVEEQESAMHQLVHSVG